MSLEAASFSIGIKLRTTANQSSTSATVLKLRRENKSEKFRPQLECELEEVSTIFDDKPIERCESPVVHGFYFQGEVEERAEAANAWADFPGSSPLLGKVYWLDGNARSHLILTSQK